jgi:outer membrane protein assembly factor BamB
VHPPSTQDIVVAGQKNGIVWALDRDDGHIVWATVKSIPYMYIICMLKVKHFMPFMAKQL